LRSHGLEVFERPVFLCAARKRMDDREVLAPESGNLDARRSFRERLRRKKCERQVRDSLAEFRTSGAVPGINFVEPV
jgi:hypothetical protein